MARKGVTRRRMLQYAGAGGLVGAGIAGALPWAFGAETLAVEAEPLDPLAIEKYRNQLSVPRVLAPSVIRDSSGRVVRHDYAMSQNVIQAQILPPPMPQTTVWAFGGRCRVPGSTATEFVASTPGPIFENTRGIPARVNWRDQINRPHILPVDPKIIWANPNGFEAPVEPFKPFPPGLRRRAVPGTGGHPHARPGRQAAVRRHGRGVVHPVRPPGRELREQRLRDAQRAAGYAAVLPRPRDGDHPAQRLRGAGGRGLLHP